MSEHYLEADVEPELSGDDEDDAEDMRAPAHPATLR